MNQNKSVPETAWPRPAAAAPAGRHLSQKKRALAQSALIGAVAALMILVLKHIWFGLFLCVLGLAVLISGLFIPAAFKAFERFGQLLARWVGTGLTWILMTLFFCMGMIPGRLILLLAGRDPMRRRKDAALESYWIAHKPEQAASYTRQY
ncbi:MAG: hypothetical protein PHP98_07630 [Kiritimatiellae bacterium]|jgi:hypothetical protein|nr:hypothetical protein [Kiritimatiellia bacterium]